MRSRRVLVLRLGVWGLGIDAKSLRSVRKLSQASSSVRRVFTVSSLLDSRCVLFSRLKSVNSHSDLGGRGRETQNCRRFWTRFGSSRLTSVNSLGDRGVVVAQRRAVVTFGLALRFRVSKKCQQSQRSGGSCSRNAELSSLLDSLWVFASQKC